MCVTEGPFDRVRAGTASRQPQQLEARMTGQPLLNCLCFVNAMVVRYKVDASVTLNWITALERVEQVAKEHVCFALPETGMNQASAHIPSLSEIVLLVPAGREYFGLRALRHPLIAGLRRQGDIEFVDKQEGQGRPKSRQKRPSRDRARFFHMNSPMGIPEGSAAVWLCESESY